MANKFKQQQKAQLRTSEQDGTYTAAEAKAYVALDPTDTIANYDKAKEGFGYGGFNGNNPQSPQQQTQFRTGEQDGTYTTAAKKAYPSL